MRPHLSAATAMISAREWYVRLYYRLSAQSKDRRA